MKPCSRRGTTPPISATRTRTCLPIKRPPRSSSRLPNNEITKASYAKIQSGSHIIAAQVIFIASVS
jgi:hypothetical protein